MSNRKGCVFGDGALPKQQTLFFFKGPFIIFAHEGVFVRFGIFFFHLVFHVVVKNVSGLISFSSVSNSLLVAVKKVHAVAAPRVVAAECGST